MNDKKNSLEENQQPQENSDNIAEQSETIPVIEEQLQVDKKFVETGKVIISKTVNQHETSVTIPLTHEEFDVQRVAVNKVVDTPPPAISYEGDTMIIPVVREVLVVQKRYEIVEEVRVTKRVYEKQETQKVTLLKEEVNIERRKTDDNNQKPVQ